MIPVAWTDLPALGTLSEARRAALEAYLAQGLPHTRQEDWHYTALDHLTRLPLHPPAGTDARQVLDEVPGHDLIFAGTRLVQAGSTLPSPILRPMQEQDLDATTALAPRTALTALNAALWRSGGHLDLPPGQRLERPVFLRHLTDEAQAMLHPRSRIRLGADAEAVVVESYAGTTPANYWCNAVTEIELAPGARLTHVRLIEEGAGATHTGLTAVRMERDSRYNLLDLSLDGRVCRHELHLRLAGEGAVCRLDGLFLTDGRRHSDHHLRVEHAVPRTTSRTCYRGVASGRGRGIFDARVLIRPGADATDARQDSRNLLLSPHAEIDAKPQLEIYADQVQASHGATVGRLSDEALFYMRSRGIEGSDARRLLLAAFAGEALGLIQEAGLGDWLMPRIEARLHDIGETMK
jgi:Fe-S cluster assembly protein SufD